MKLLMENWRKFVKAEQDADEANELINEAVSQFLSSNPKLLKEFIGPGNPLYDGDEEEEEEEAEEETEEEEEAEEAEEVIDDIEDEVADEIGDNEYEEDEDEDFPADAVEDVDISDYDEGTRLGRQMGSKISGLVGFIGGVSQEIGAGFGKSTIGLLKRALGATPYLRDLAKDVLKAGGDIAASLPEAAKGFVAAYQKGKDIKELAKNNPEGFNQALKTLEEKVFDLKLPGVNDPQTAAVFLHQSEKGRRSIKKAARSAIKKAAKESADLSTAGVKGLLTAYMEFSAHAAKVASKQAQEVEES
tara:strand:+ start:50 stop:958 length:909 start_codon:yes stop_codon:yes gene_type:complete